MWVGPFNPSCLPPYIVDIRAPIKAVVAHCSRALPTTALTLAMQQYDEMKTYTSDLSNKCNAQILQAKQAQEQEVECLVKSCQWYTRGDATLHVIVLVIFVTA
jgi:hypothetical protein